MIHLRLARASFFASLFVLLASACGGNDSSGGPPQVPCDEISKGHAPICGESCKAKCGCKTCQVGETLMENDLQFVCNGKCFAFSSSATGGTSSGGAPSGGGAPGGGGTPSGGGSGGAAGNGSGGFGLVGGSSGAGGT